MAIQGEKYYWNLPCDNTELTAHIASRFNLSIPVIQTLITRHYTTEQEIESFLFSSKEKDVAHPSVLKDANKAVERILQAIELQEKILICGDYDVDGITSSALLLTCLLPLGAHINFFLPNRARDGYGLSATTVERAARNNYRCIITVDNGITAFQAAQTAQRLGIDLIITDHHRPHAELPPALAIVNPHQSSCTYPFKGFAGVGVGFKLMSLLYERLHIPLPPKVYELLLLGTIADVVPLVSENRFWVRYGLQQIKDHQTAALKVLKKNGRITKPTLSALDIGFFITPQINALGRLEDPRDAVKFLMSTDELEVERIGAVLAALNETRKAVERSTVQEIEHSLKDIDFSKERIIMASSTQWLPGVIGLAASRLVSAYHRPALLFHITPEGIAKGSCRSIPKFNIFNALTQVQDLLTTFGGHAAAAGLSLPAHLLPTLKKRLEEIVDASLGLEDLRPSLAIDARLSLPEVTRKLVYDLAYMEPFGCDNTVPLFHVPQVTMTGQPQLFKEAHVKCTVFAEGVVKPVIFFNRPELFTKIQNASSATFGLAVHVLENVWNSETRVELQGIDLTILP